MTESAAPAVIADLRQIKSELAISRHVAASTGAGFVPLPLADLALVGGVQLDLLYRLCRIYEQPFSRRLARGTLTSLLGGAVPGLQATFFASSGLKMIPGIGSAASFFATPVLAGATTYAVGRVFVDHLQNGGTLLSFDAAKMKSQFESAFEDGKKMVGMGGKKAAPAAEPAAASSAAAV